LVQNFVDPASEMTYIVSSGALNSTHSLNFVDREFPWWMQSLHFFDSALLF